jgi:hypothetical protein
MALPISTVRRIDFGYFVRPAEETGTGKPRVEALLGYAIVNEAGVLLFDTGAASNTMTRVRRCANGARLRKHACR